MPSWQLIANQVKTTANHRPPLDKSYSLHRPHSELSLWLALLHDFPWGTNSCSIVDSSTSEIQVVKPTADPGWGAPSRQLDMAKNVWHRYAKKLWDTQHWSFSLKAVVCLYCKWWNKLICNQGSETQQLQHLGLRNYARWVHVRFSSHAPCCRVQHFLPPLPCVEMISNVKTVMKSFADFRAWGLGNHGTLLRFGTVCCLI